MDLFSIAVCYTLGLVVLHKLSGRIVNSATYTPSASNSVKAIATTVFQHSWFALFLATSETIRQGVNALAVIDPYAISTGAFVLVVLLLFGVSPIGRLLHLNVLASAFAEGKIPDEVKPEYILKYERAKKETEVRFNVFHHVVSAGIGLVFFLLVVKIVVI
ncbi:hypothetical protein [Vibrio crassostreae]|uniref:hypothetical protein n=1 Tax=Vibrio crassostreae TaxID=246167 RepID=UPI001B310EFF|nr:hypothetical protein [Vibrio crassostreae]